MLKEFRDFIMTGNVIDLAVGVILGAAVGSVVNGFVADIAMPIVGYLTGGVDFSSMKYVLNPAVLDSEGNVITPENAILYGKWITSIVSLILIGFVLFLIVKAYNRTRKQAEPAPEPPAGPTEVDLLIEIRDSLKK